MISGFISVILFKFVFQEMEGIGPYLVELDVLAPSFAVAMIVGWVFSKLYPPKQSAIDAIGLQEPTNDDSDDFSMNSDELLDN